jgi:hypothetical protein
MKALCSITLAIILTGCAGGGSSPAKDAHAPAPPSARQLSGNEISTQVIGRTHNSVTTAGQTFSETLTPDGSARINITGSPAATGDWTLKGDVLCVTYEAYGQECNIVKTDEQWLWFIDSNKGTTNNRFAR